MAKRYIYSIICMFFILILAGCKSTKYVPEGEYLLNKVAIKSDVPDVKKEELQSYLRQTPNASVLGFWKLQLGVYNLSGKDTTKWINRMLRKIGDAPEIYNPEQTDMSLYQMQKFLQNKGYFNAEITTELTTKKQKAKVTYHVKGNRPYILNRYQILIDQPDVYQIASDTAHSLIKKNMLFDSNVLDAERERIASEMRNQGFYNFEKDYLNYVADSSMHNNTINLQLGFRQLLTEANDSLKDKIFTQYRIKEVIIHTDYDPLRRNNIEERVDTIRKGDYLISYGKKRNLRIQTLINNCFLVPGELYSDRDVEKTYATLNALAAIKYVNLLFREVEPGWLTCYVVTTPAKSQAFTVEGEGTYSAGDIGVAGGIGYQHRNLFRGSEQFSIQGRAAYEWRQVGGNAIELGADASLKFPSFLIPFVNSAWRRSNNAATDLNVSYNYQKRPLEYSRTIASAGINYSWHKQGSRFRHSYDLVDFSYVYLPWISDEFKDYFLNNQSVLKYSYEDHFIMRMAYNGSYSTYRPNRPLSNYYSLRYGVETAGNLLYGINHLFKMQPADDGSFRVFNIRYSQYVKADFDFAYNQVIDPNNRFVYHAALGVGLPYGNAASLPFEKRYYSGGANSVRGWAVRTLGPGTFKTDNTYIDFNNQSGDIKLDLNVEYRVKLFSVLEGALFLDAGNIWTIHDYETQPGGLFRFDTFYKQIAVAYGLGIRLNFNFFVFRIDYGLKLYDPALVGQDRWRVKPTWKDDMAFHFAIGYPF